MLEVLGSRIRKTVPVSIFEELARRSDLNVYNQHRQLNQRLQVQIDETYIIHIGLPRFLQTAIVRRDPSKRAFRRVMLMLVLMLMLLVVISLRFILLLVLLITVLGGVRHRWTCGLLIRHSKRSGRRRPISICFWDI